MKRLNVGCGRDLKKGWVNLDAIILRCKKKRTK